MSQHWYSKNHRSNDSYYIYDGTRTSFDEPFIVAETFGPEAEQQAHDIVRACNRDHHFDALVAELENLLSQVSAARNEHVTAHQVDWDIAGAKAALEAVKA